MCSEDGECAIPKLPGGAGGREYSSAPWPGTSGAFGGARGTCLPGGCAAMPAPDGISTLSYAAPLYYERWGSEPHPQYTA